MEQALDLKRDVMDFTNDVVLIIIKRDAVVKRP